MKEWLTLARHSICAGLLIGCGGFVYTMTGGVIGALLFAFGLFGVLYGKWALYTGYAGSFAWCKAKDWEQLFYILVGNWIGVMAMALIASVSNEAIVEQYTAIVQKIVTDRLSSEWWQLVIRGIGTGFIMEIAVRYGRKQKWMTVLLGVPVFILCGLPHCVADIYYYSIDWLMCDGCAVGYIVPWVSAVVGNLIGCNIPRLLT